MTDKRVVLTACGSIEEARHIARELVDRRLAACVNIVPQIESVYRWKGEIESATECLLIVKTTLDASERLCDAITKLHSYDVPEVVQFAIESGNHVYLKWIENSVE